MKTSTDVGRAVVQYDYVAKREAVGTITGTRYVYSAARGNDVLLFDVQWSDADGGVTTSHCATKFCSVAGRDELLLNDV